MAANGYLTELEIEIIERKGAEARERIGTDHEQKAALSPTTAATSSTWRLPMPCTQRAGAAMRQ